MYNVCKFCDEQKTDFVLIYNENTDSTQKSQQIFSLKQYTFSQATQHVIILYKGSVYRYAIFLFIWT